MAWHWMPVLCATLQRTFSMESHKDIPSITDMNTYRFFDKVTIYGRKLYSMSSLQTLQTHYINFRNIFWNCQPVPTIDHNPQLSKFTCFLTMCLSLMIDIDHCYWLWLWTILHTCIAFPLHEGNRSITLLLMRNFRLSQYHAETVAE